MYISPIPTRTGRFIATFSDRELAALAFPAGPSSPLDEAVARTPLPPRVAGWARLTRAALTDALAGQPPAELPPLDLSTGTEFQQGVWQAMLRIATGDTRSYGQIAADIGRPKAVRAVGQACGANPVPVLVPCHRVTASGGRLGGFSSGLEWKRKLLAFEGIEVTDAGKVAPRA